MAALAFFSGTTRSRWKGFQTNGTRFTLKLSLQGLRAGAFNFIQMRRGLGIFALGGPITAYGIPTKGKNGPDPQQSTVGDEKVRHPFVQVRFARLNQIGNFTQRMQDGALIILALQKGFHIGNDAINATIRQHGCHGVPARNVHDAIQIRQYQQYARATAGRGYADTPLVVNVVAKVCGSLGLWIFVALVGIQI